MQTSRKLFFGLLLFLAISLSLMYGSLRYPRFKSALVFFPSFTRSSYTLSTPRSLQINITVTTVATSNVTSIVKPNRLTRTTVSTKTEVKLTSNTPGTTTPLPPRILCANFIGRLGNQLFQYSTLFSLAKRLHRIPVYPDKSSLRSVLQNPFPKATNEQKQRCSKAKAFIEKGCCHFQKGFLELDPKQDYRIGMYLQSYVYWEGVEKELRKTVVFKDKVQAKANKTIDQLRPRCNKTLVGIHIRRGDFLKPQNIKHGYTTAPASYYHKAMDYMRHRFTNVTFFVSVDNEKWFKENVTTAKDVIVLKRQEAETDMAVLTSLDHVIISVGTYSWWVGYLNKGVTVYWKDFINVGTPIGRSFNPNGTTFVYPDWIPL